MRNGMNEYYARIGVYLFDINHNPLNSLDRDQHSNPESVSLGVEKMFIIVEGRESEEGDTFRIVVQIQ